MFHKLQMLCEMLKDRLRRIIFRKRYITVELDGNTKPESVKKTESPEEKFIKVWASVLTEKAKVFNGLYSSLQRIMDGKAKKPERVISEWSKRTRYQWESREPDMLCREYLLPLMEKGTDEEYRKWTGLLLKAAEASGMTHDTPGAELTLNEKNVNAYNDWDGNELYLDDTVEVKIPAWYQNGMIIEQGSCIRTKDAEDDEEE